MNFKSIILFLFILNQVVICSEFDIISRIGTSAKSIGIGNIIGVHYSSNDIFGNPANIYAAKDTNISLFSTQFINEVNYKTFTISKRFDFGSIGFGYMSKAIGDIIHTGEDSQENGGEFFEINTFNYKNSITKFSYANLLRLQKLFGFKNIPLLYGANINFYNISLHNITGKGINFDIGTHFATKKYTISLTMKNILLGSTVNYSNNGIEKIPSSLILSSKYFYKGFNIYSQLERSEKKLFTSFGADYELSFIKNLTFSIGKKGILVQAKKQSNITFGIDFKMKGIGFNYAYESSKHILYKNKHYFSLNFTI